MSDNPLDFFLAAFDEHPPTYSTPWGVGRPLTHDQVKDWLYRSRRVTRADLYATLVHSEECTPEEARRRIEDAGGKTGTDELTET